MFVPKDIRIHMVGIGGTGMSGIAELLLNLGYTVTGSDLVETPTIQRLRKLGAIIYIGHDKKHIEQADVVVISSAIRNDNPEVVASMKRNIPVIPRIEMLAELMRIRQGIAIAGAHGKTTTTSMIGTLLAHAGFDPTIVVGGRLRSLGTNAYLGKSNWIVVETDESDRSFLRLNPIISVVTNIDEEHIHTYGHMEALVDAFIQFCNQVPFYGVTIVCLEDPYIQKNLFRMKRRVLTYGLTPHAYLWADNIELNGFETHFIIHEGSAICPIRLKVPGVHNVLNAVASAAVGRFLGIEWDVIREGLERFEGVERRFQKKGEYNNIWVVDDYAHHPTEISKTIDTAVQFKRNRLIVVFQPHRYTRVSRLWDDFTRCFYKVHHLVVLPIYPAGEDAIPGVNAERLADEIRKKGHRSVYFAHSIESAAQHVYEYAQEGDLILTLGAGTVYKVGERVLELAGVR